MFLIRYVHGMKDTTVEIEHTRILHNMLLGSNYVSEMIELPDAQHAFGLYDFMATDEEITKTMEDIVHFKSKIRKDVLFDRIIDSR